MALMMANAGGAWDNAKKFIEKGNLGGKGLTCTRQQLSEILLVTRLKTHQVRP